MRITLLTGATGALGGELLKRLVADGKTVVCLTRGKGEETARERVKKIIGEGPDIAVIPGDICQPQCGISDNDKELFRGQVANIVHCAASISFWNRAEAEATNVGGVQNVLELAEVLGVNEIHHISTSYVSGGADEFDENTPLSSITHHPRNVYEETKQTGEALIKTWAESHSLRQYSIYRPSILVGRQDGTTPTFDAYYGWFAPIHRILQMMRAQKDAGKKLPFDVAVDEKGMVDIPLVLYASSSARLNLVPIDWVADVITKLFSVSPQNKVYHLTNPIPPLVRGVIAVSLSYLNMRTGEGSKFRIVGNEAEKKEALAAQSPLVSRLQRELDRVLDQYKPYTSHGPLFHAENARNALGADFQGFRVIDSELLCLFLQYALETNWNIPKKIK